MEQKLDYEHRLTEVEDRSKSNSHRLDEIERRQDDLEGMQSALNVLADREKRVESDVKEIKSDVKDLASKPAKRWDNLVDKVLMTLVGAILGVLLAKMGM